MHRRVCLDMLTTELWRLCLSVCNGLCSIWWYLWGMWRGKACRNEGPGVLLQRMSVSRMSMMKKM